MRGGLFVEFVGPSCRGAAALRPHEAVSRPDRPPGTALQQIHHARQTAPNANEHHLHDLCVTITTILTY
eukprot:scaffold1789_cov102-Skeletonema_dohrnii-CCMP3373.AAC.1